MNICVIGNSHVAAIKQAYDLMAARGDIPAMTFFANRGDNVAKMVVKNGILKPAKENHRLQAAIEITSGGIKEIDPQKYDFILVLGLGRAISELTAMVLRPISAGAKERAIQDFWEASVAFELIEKLRLITKKTIFFGLAPLTAAKEDGPETDDTYREMLALSQTLFFDAIDVSIVRQPPATITHGGNTKSEYARDSQRLDVQGGAATGAHPIGENRHMNAAYGEAWLEGFFAALT